jgi:hypothetical protein
MNLEPDVGFVFVCRGCGQRILVDEGVRRTLVETGSCFICDEPVTEANFERRQ